MVQSITLIKLNNLIVFGTVVSLCKCQKKVSIFRAIKLVSELARNRCKNCFLPFCQRDPIRNKWQTTHTSSYSTSHESLLCTIYFYTIWWNRVTWPNSQLGKI